MAYLAGNERAQYVREVFARIAPRYDLMNRLMTGGQDVRWRREVVRRAGLAPNARVLDVGAGTGDLTREVLRQQPTARVVAADFSFAMMRIGQCTGPCNWSAADALCLPFPDDTFDAVVSGFLLRNVGSVPQALAEQRRVLKRGGRVVVLDTTRPGRHWLSPLIWAHLHIVIPLAGRLIAGAHAAYTYLPASTESFLPAEVLAKAMTAAGFQKASFQRLMFGTVAIHWGEK